MPLLHNAYADLHIPGAMDIRQIPLSFGSVPSVLLRLSVNAHTHIHRYRSIFRHNISISPTHENLHLPLRSTADMGLCFPPDISIRILHENHRQTHRSPGGDSLRRGVAHRRHQEALRNRHLSAAVLPSLLHHPNVLSVHFLQVAEEQEKACQEQELQEEEQLRESAAEKDDDEPNARADGWNLWRLLASFKPHQHLGRLQHESQRTHVLQSVVLHFALSRNVFCHLQSISLRVAERKLP